MKTIAQQLNVTEFPFRIKDKKGNEIYFEDSDGNWYKCEYDSNRTTIYHEDSNKFWYKREYDSNGKLIYFENSNKYWIKYKLDSKGNQIYYETPYRKNRRVYKYPNPCENKVVEIDGIKYKLVKA